MSAFLKYSQKRRKEVKEANPEMNNTDISRLLGELWRAADPSEKEPYVESEKVERAMYNDAIANWREEQAQLDAASRTSHHSVHQHSLEQSVAAPNVKKHRRDHDRETVSESSRATSSTNTSMVATTGSTIDRRIFRPYSGSGHSVENKAYKSDHRKFHPSYHHNESARHHIAKVEPNAYHPKIIEARPYKSESMDSTSTGGPNMIQSVSYPSRHHPSTYRPSYPVPSQNQGEHRHALPNTGSDLYDNTFYEPEPPFNPRQTRPSSHCFPDSYFYP
jgi:hypothetical protein